MKLNKILLSAAIFSLINANAYAIPEVPNVIKNPAEVPQRIARTTPKAITVNLTAKEVLTDIDGSGRKAVVWTFDSTIPGTMIRVMEGDIVTLNLTNDPENTEPHNIDLHAVMGPGGGAVATEALPGETKTVVFKAARQGTYVYHCAAEGKAWEHIANGMVGLIVVEPVGGLPYVDKEFYVGQSDWYHTPDASGQLTLNEDQALMEKPSFFTFNGHTEALSNAAYYGDSIHVKKGEKVRFFFTNGGPNKGSHFHIIGTVFDKTYKGHFGNVQRNEETEYVSPGSAVTFDMVMPVEGKFVIVDHTIFRASNGALGFMIVDPSSTTNDVDNVDIKNNLPPDFVNTEIGKWKKNTSHHH